MSGTNPLDRDALLSATLRLLPEAEIAAAKFGADPKIVARKLAIARLLAAEESEVAPEAIAAAAKFGADPKIVARKLAINKQLQDVEARGWR